VATGHYARVKKNKDGKFELLKAKDAQKDQTYSLSYLTQAELSRCVFPLGIFSKDEVYEFARQEGIGEIFDKIKQSQDFCFVSGKSLKSFIAKEIGPKSGEIVDESGKVLGSHDGVYFYTIGQRKDIGLSGGPFYVVQKNLAKNQIVVSKNPEKFATSEIVFDEFNLINNIDGPIEVDYKLRSTQSLRSGKLSLEGEKLKLTFSIPELFVTPGQVAVFYIKDVCLGMGTIK
jgi:tRNA-specific 2-thiouridylase